MKLLNMAFVWLILFISFPSQGAQTPTPAFYQEVITVLQKYIQINTSNPPGAEMKSALFLKQLLDREGIESEIMNLGSDRANLIAKLPGSKPTNNGIALLHHMDVVPAESKFWTHPPFAGLLEGGEIHGRGAIDIKGKGVLDLMALVWLKRNKIQLTRDVYLFAVADEEVASMGAKTLIAQKPDLLRRIAVVVDEGKTVHQTASGEDGDFYVSVGEKSPLWLTLTFTGPPGHGSVPLAGSAVNQAIEAGSKIIRFAKLLTKEPAPPALRSLVKDPSTRALLYHTISVTGLRGSDKINTISNEASIQLDCRLLPGTSKESFISRLQKVIGNSKMKVAIEEHYDSRFSPTDSEFLRALTRVAKARGKKVIPTILTSSTDSSLFRAAGIEVYGFEPYPATDAIVDTAHANNERINAESFKRGLVNLIDLLKEIDR